MLEDELNANLAGKGGHEERIAETEINACKSPEATRSEA